MNWTEQVIQAIEEQQKKLTARSAPWMVGEQLKDICRREPESAELIAQDLQVEAMSLQEAEKKIKAFADAHKTGSFACVTPAESDRILREFYGLKRPDEGIGPYGARAGLEPAPTGTGRTQEKISLDLADFL
jgi:hypothetical protein